MYQITMNAAGNVNLNPFYSSLQHELAFPRLLLVKITHHDTNGYAKIHFIRLSVFNLNYLSQVFKMIHFCRHYFGSKNTTITQMFDQSLLHNWIGEWP